MDIINSKTTRVLVLGATGMLGNAVFRLFSGSAGFESWGSARSVAGVQVFPENLRTRVITGIDVENVDSLAKLFAQVRPQVVINCIGLVKQLTEANDPLQAIPVNALLPHRLARLCDLAGARFVHVSTDCVFDGRRGMYREQDPADAQDLYGRSKHLGEVDYPHAITLRTSIIGHELQSSHGLLCWFLAQTGPVRGFTKAVFSGLPVGELARVVRDYVVPNPQMHGMYHVSASPITKYDLLRLVADVYGLTTTIVPDDRVVIDRSLDSARFQQATGYRAPDWPTLVRSMREFG